MSSYIHDNHETLAGRLCSNNSHHASPSNDQSMEGGEGGSLLLPMLTILMERIDLNDENLASANHDAAEGSSTPTAAVSDQHFHPDDGDEPIAAAAAEAATSDDPNKTLHHFWTSNDSNAALIAPYSYEPEDPAVREGESILHGQKLSLIRLNARPCSNNTTATNNNTAGGGDDQHQQHYGAKALDPNPSSSSSSVPSSSLLPPDPTLQKYWNQRHLLFSKFDEGIRLDHEGWFSVTPEQIATHVAAQVPRLLVSSSLCQHQQHQEDHHRHHDHVGDNDTQNGTNGNIIVLDAFGGCGGNAIAFAKRLEIAHVICVDLDREKLRHAAHNAAIYKIPTDKISFVECNVIFILQFCYAQGTFILDAPLENVTDAMAMMDAMPPAVPMERYQGFAIGGIDLLPRHVHVVFMDPPWGGVDYNAFGRFGYSLQDHMRIPRRHSHLQDKAAADAFFDSFAPTNDQERKAAFNCTLDETSSVSGAELLRLAARAAHGATVIYDIPRNTNRNSLGEAALAAGYRGNCKLDEHYWNGRLKTVTAYFGKDWRNVEDDGTSNTAVE